MSFRFYTNVLSEASRAFATGIFVVGLLLIGFGILILALPELFALLAAMVFFFAGTGCAVVAVKIFLARRKLEDAETDDPWGHRGNVSVHHEEYHQW